jgi:YkoY family integral membrane protein
MPLFMFNLPPQVFALGDVQTVALLLGLEILLSADNAIILAVLVRHLPEDQQKRALFYGLAGAFFFRGIAILCAVWISGLWWFQLIGAAYLIFICVKHFMSHGGGEKKLKAKEAGFWATVFYVELTDVAFAVDSVLVAIAVEKRPEKFWVVFTGAMIGVFALRWAAGIFLKLLKKFPILDHMAFILVGWAGLKLLFLSVHTFEVFYKDSNPGKSLPFHVPVMEPGVFWGGVVAIVLAAVLIARKQGATPDFELIEEIEEIREELEGTFTEDDGIERPTFEQTNPGAEALISEKDLGKPEEIADSGVMDAPEDHSKSPDQP